MANTIATTAISALNGGAGIDTASGFIIKNGVKSVTIDTVNFDGTDRVWFDRLGAPYSGAIITNTPLMLGEVTVRAGSSSYTVTVEPVSGRIKVNE